MDTSNLPDSERLGFSELTEATKKKLAVLFEEDLFDRVIQEIQLKVVGEEETIKTIFLCSCGRLVSNSQISSFNLLVNDVSGVGKDYVTDNTLKIWGSIKNGILHKRTRISPTAFTYWKQLSKKQKDAGFPEWCWDGKIVYLEDVSNNVLNSETFKVMCSSGSHATIVRDQVAKDIRVNGKPVIIITSASASPKEENIRRFAIVNLDSSEEQTRKIMQQIADKATTGHNVDYNENLSASLTCLDRLPAIVPYAKELFRALPTGIIMRTHGHRLLDLIKASCCLHQKQRNRDSEGRLISDKQDYLIAKAVIRKITSNPKMVSLTKNQQRLLALFEKLKHSEKYAVSELEAMVSFMSERQIRREVDKLTDLGFLQKDKEERFGSNKMVMVYQYVPMGSINIPEWDELKKDGN